MRFKKISSLRREKWLLTLSESKHTHRPVQVLAGCAHVTIGVSRCLSPLQIKAFLLSDSLPAVKTDAYVRILVCVRIMFEVVWLNEQSNSEQKVRSKSALYRWGRGELHTVICPAAKSISSRSFTASWLPWCVCVCSMDQLGRWLSLSSN